MHKNRSEQIKIDSNEFKITDQILADIDAALINQLKNTIGIFVIENGRKIDVPVEFATGERWAQIQENRILRDTKNQAILPFITVKRTSIEPVLERYIYPTGANRITVLKKLAKENAWKPVKNTIDPNIPIAVAYDIEPPVYIDVNYTLLAQARYIQSMNSIIEQIIMQHPKFDIQSENGHYLRVEITGFNDESNVDDFSDELRLISNSADVKVSGYVYSNIKNNKLNYRKIYSPGKISFTERII